MLKNGIHETKLFETNKKLAHLMFAHISDLNLSKETFAGLENLKHLSIKRCTIENFREDVFEHLKNLEHLYFFGNSVHNFNVNAFLKLTSLKTFGLYDNVGNPAVAVDYGVFRNLPLLEHIHFPEDALRKLSYKDFKNLKYVDFITNNVKCAEDMYNFIIPKNIVVTCADDFE